MLPKQLVATVVLPGGPMGEFDYLIPPVLTAGIRSVAVRGTGRRRCACRWAAGIGVSWAIVWRWA